MWFSFFLPVNHHDEHRISYVQKFRYTIKTTHSLSPPGGVRRGCHRGPDLLGPGDGRPGLASGAEVGDDGRRWPPRLLRLPPRPKVKDQGGRGGRQARTWTWSLR